jgi:hypothetical protein
MTMRMPVMAMGMVVMTMRMFVMAMGACLFHMIAKLTSAISSMVVIFVPDGIKLLHLTLLRIAF